MKRLLFLLIIQLPFAGVFGQPAAPDTILFGPALYTGFPNTAELSLKKGSLPTVNSILFKNDIKGITYRYPVGKLQQKPAFTLDLGQADLPGLYFLQIDTINNSIGSRQRLDGLYGRYRAFMHPANQGDCNCDNSKNAYPIVPDTSKGLPAGDWILLDSLITRLQTDTVNNKMDYYVSKQYPDSVRCDTSRTPSWRLAFVVTNSPGDADTFSLVSVVIDTLGANKPPNEQAIIDSAFELFRAWLLDTSKTAADAAAIADTTKKKLANRMITVKAGIKCETYYSNGFVRQAFMFNKRLDIDYVCKQFCVYRRTGVFNQLVLLAKIPIPSP